MVVSHMESSIDDELIRLLIIGGTIDKVYNPVPGELTFDKTQIPKILEQARCRLNTVSEILMLKDSLYMNDSDREAILERCKSYKERRVVITHGTDTMVETAKVLGTNIRDKVIVLTGAMVPYSFGSSDASFNLGVALGCVQTLPNEVYVGMNGRIFPWYNVRKNKERGEFEELS